jgi:hypothetical protein
VVLYPNTHGSLGVNISKIAQMIENKLQGVERILKPFTPKTRLIMSFESY